MKASYLLLLFLIASSTAYKYEYVPSESFEEEEPILGFNFLGLIIGFIKGRIINTLKNPQFWISKIKEKMISLFKDQFQKLAENNNSQMHIIFDDIIECDQRVNRKNNEQVIAIRKEVGLPLDIREFCQGNTDCGTKIRNDYDYLDYVIFKIPMPKNAPYELEIMKGLKFGRRKCTSLNACRFLSEDPRKDPKYLEARAKIDNMQKIIRQMDENFHKCIIDPAPLKEFSSKERLEIYKRKIKALRHS